jgi:endoglucanase
LPAGYLHTQGARIVDVNNTGVRLAGVNWYGFDCTSTVAGGLDHQPLSYICQQIVNLGFNVIRLPFCVQVVQDNPTITSYLDANPSLQDLTALQIMDALINTAGKYGLKVILDNHRSEAGWSTQSNGLWYTQTYPESTWISTWQTMVQRYAANSTVIGCDLRNELSAPPPDSTAWPQNNGAEWGYNDPAYNTTQDPGNWVTAAQKAGNAILAINSNLLIFVEGVRYDPAGPVFPYPTGSHYLYWPGGNLMGVGNAGGPRTAPTPVTLNVPNRLVYSIHDYGPDMYSGLAWGQLSSTQADCNSVWDQTWGYIVKNNVAPIWIGEFGTANGYKPNDTTPQSYYTDPNSVNPQGGWFTHLTTYVADLQANYGGGNWCYWCVNGSQSQAPGRDPSQPDWYGVLDPTWSGAASQPMMTKLRTIQ